VLITKLKLWAVVILHLATIFMNFAAFFALIYFCNTNEDPWYRDVQVFQAWPICSVILFLSFARGLECPITRLENYYRRELKMPEIKGFIKHYVIKPYISTRRKISKLFKKKKSVDSLQRGDIMYGQDGNPIGIVMENGVNNSTGHIERVCETWKTVDEILR